MYNSNMFTKSQIYIVIIIIILVIGGLFLVQKTANAPVVVVSDFETCIEAGNPAMESYPRQCRNNDVTYVEDISVRCTEEQRDVLCTQQYEPVCGLVNVQCITTPCDPVEETFGNSCTACSNSLVESYTPGECILPTN